MKRDKEWLKKAVDELPCVDTVFEYDGMSYVNTAVSVNQVYDLINQLDEPEVLSFDWIEENKKDSGVHYIGYYVPIGRLHDLLVPTLSEMETADITERQIMDWLDDNDFFHHATAETVLANAVDKGELGYYGTKYSVVKKEPEIDGISDVGGGMNAIKPEHYRKGAVDLYESWYRTRPFAEFRAILESIAERYMKRDKVNRLEDLDKAIYTLQRLREYEEKEVAE